MSKDYYAILGVPKTATADEIKKAFRRLAHEHHPDKGGNEQKFKDVNEAYQVLGDDKKRTAFDRFGSAAFEQGGPGPGGPGGFGGFDFGGFGGGGFQVNMNDLGDLGDVLGEMFGFGRSGGGRGKPRGQDIHVDVELAFKESIFGVKKEITLLKFDRCDVCKGEGAAAGSKRVSCKTCSGSGQVKQAQRTMFGTMQVASTCPACHGSGTVPETPCKSCSGEGIARRESRLSVDIPAGISDGDALKMPGQGEAARHGGSPGDLYIRLHVAADPRFSREGTTLRSEVEVPFSTLALGGSITVETVDGSRELSIRERTPTGTELVLNGAGVPTGRRADRGDHIVTVKAAIPKKLTREQEQALEALRLLGL
jgi:molecular chaperone DnaJ